MVHISNINTIKSVCYPHVHSIIKYAIIFEGNSPNSGKIFTLQKKIVWIMADTTQHLMYNSVQTIGDSTCSIPVYNFINELHYQ